MAVKSHDDLYKHEYEEYDHKIWIQDIGKDKKERVQMSDSNIAKYIEKCILALEECDVNASFS